MEEVRVMGDSMEYRAIVTGASSGIGMETAITLCRLGYKVYGIGREFGKEDHEKRGFVPVVCDVLDTEKLGAVVKDIAEGHRVKLLINNAGAGYYGLHEELNTSKIQQMVRTNLEVPMVLTQLLLRDLKKNKGMVINISSVTSGRSNPHGCAYGATKAGLTSFSRSLFDETRKYGVRVVTIQPDMTRTNLYRHADFEADEAADASLLPKDVAKAVEYALLQREGMVVSEITLQPQLHRIRRKNQKK